MQIQEPQRKQSGRQEMDSATLQPRFWCASQSGSSLPCHVVPGYWRVLLAEHMWTLDPTGSHHVIFGAETPSNTVDVYKLQAQLTVSLGNHTSAC